MAKILLSYRREDSEHATGRIYDRLVAYFGKKAVFMDVDTIPSGADFRNHIEEFLTKCDVLLAIIGDSWIDAKFPSGSKRGMRRLDDPGDFVRIEIEAALD